MEYLALLWIILSIVGWLVGRDAMPKNTGCFMALLTGPFYLLNHFTSPPEEKRKVIEYNDDKNSDKPTYRQLRYAQDLGLDPPVDIKRWELSRLMDEAIEKQNPVTYRHRAFADLYGVPHNPEIKKRYLFDNIYNALKEPGRELEMAAWFTFRVYRTMVNGALNTSHDSPDDPVFTDIATQLVAFPGTVKSMKNYDGENLIWFGKYTDPHGDIHEGGSTRTTAYKQAAILLSEKLGKA
jgi:hypothetical protein